MIEDLLCEMDKPYRATKLLLIFLTDYIQDNLVSDLDMSEPEKSQNLLAVSYAINLVNESLSEMNKRYNELMIKEKYPNRKENLTEEQNIIR